MHKKAPQPRRRSQSPRGRKAHSKPYVRSSRNPDEHLAPAPTPPHTLTWALAIICAGLALASTAAGVVVAATRDVSSGTEKGFCHGGASWQPTAECMSSAHGLWGPVDSLHTFCEISYRDTSVVAEPFNALGSLIYVGAGLFHLHSFKSTGRPVRWELLVQVWVLIAVGLGSFLFHATMRYHMELLDELPMLAFMTSVLIQFGATTGEGSKLEAAHPWFASAPNRAQTFARCALAINGAAVCIYLTTHHFGFFVSAFTADVLALAVMVLSLYSKVSFVQMLIWKAILEIILARVAWEAENHLCASSPWVWPLHNMWHLLSAGSAFDMIALSYYLRLECLGISGVVDAGADESDEDGDKSELPHCRFIPWKCLPPISTVVRARP